MSNLSRKEREKLPDVDFGGPNRTFPIMDQDDVDSASHLVGKAANPEAVKSKIKAIARRKGLKLPAAWESKAAMSAGDIGPESASFKVEGRREVVDGYAVYPDATLFEAAAYEDKGFSMTPEEQWLAVENFAPVGGSIEHTDFLRGKACEVRSIRLAEDDPYTLMGEVAVPLWLDEHLGEQEKRLSAEWDRDTKALVGLSLCVRPRVEAAALMGAFTAHVESHPESKAEFNAAMTDFARTAPADDVFAAVAAFAKGHRTYHGQSSIQEMHDHAARSGAVCDPKNGRKSMFVSARERTGIQKIHDAAVEHGASCSVMSGKSMYTAEQPTRGQSMSDSLLKRCARLFGKAEAAPDTTPDEVADLLADIAKFEAAQPAESVTPPTETAASSAETTVEKTVAETTETAAAQFAIAETAEFKAQAAKIAELEASIAAEKSAREADRKDKGLLEAALFADHAVKAGVLPKGLKDGAAAIYFHLAEVDRAAGDTKANFTVGSAAATGLAEAFAYFVKGLPRNPMLDEVIDPKGRLDAKFTAMFAGDGAPAVDVAANQKAEVNSLLSATASGQNYLAKGK